MHPGDRILITGATGQIGRALVARLAGEYEVVAVARFTAAGAREELASFGAQTVCADLAVGDLSAVPADPEYVVHLAAFQGAGVDYDAALRVNAEATGLLLRHCRRAKAALVMSSHSVYAPNPDPRHAYTENDPLGDAHPTHAPTYSVSKIAQEAVARSCARMFDLPVTIARMNAAYDDRTGLPAIHLAAILAGQPVVTRAAPCTYSPIHHDDIAAQLPALLDAAGAPATIVNWAGDEPVSAQQWCAYFGELTGRRTEVVVQDHPGTQPGAIADVTRRRELTGPCRVDWRSALAQAPAALTMASVANPAISPISSP